VYNYEYDDIQSKFKIFYKIWNVPDLEGKEAIFGGGGAEGVIFGGGGAEGIIFGAWTLSPADISGFEQNLWYNSKLTLSNWRFWKKCFKQISV
jgi:hypothetical protein